MMQQLIKPKLNAGAQELCDNLAAALKLGPMVRLEVHEFAEREGINIRTAQRYVKAVSECDDFKFIKRYGSSRYFGRNDADWRELLGVEHEFVQAKVFQNGTSVVSVVCVVPILYLYIYKGKEDPKISDDTNDTDDKLNDNGVGPSLIVVEDSSDGAYQELVSMACHVCKRSALMLLEDDEAILMKMFRGGVNADLVYQRYSRSTVPNYWYHGYWKGKNNAWPTFKDLIVTWEKSAEYSPQKHDSWPTVKEICETMEAIMLECGNKKPETAMRKYAEYGYDEIMRRIPGGYVQMCRVSEIKMRIAIAIAIREIKGDARNKE